MKKTQRRAIKKNSFVTVRNDESESSRYLAAIIESSDDAIISKDLNGIIQTWNRGAERIFGYKAAEIIGKPVSTLIPLEYFDEEPSILERLRKGIRIDHYETVRQRKDGTLINVSLTISPIKDERGKIVGASKIARDITERKRSQLMMQRFSAIVESTDDAIIGKNLQGIIETWNQGAEKLFGYRAGEIIGKSILLLIPPERRAEETQIIADISSGKRVVHFETVRLRKDGSPVEVSLTISPIKDVTGKVVGASKIARDITERKRVESQQLALYKLATTVNRTGNLQEVYVAAIDAIIQCQGTNRVSILLCDDLGVMRFKAWRGISTAYRLSVETHSPWKRDDMNRHPILVAEAATGLKEPVRTAAKREGIGALASIPILFENRLLGKVEIYYNLSHRFTREEIHPAETIATQIAFAVERKRDIAF